MELYEDSMDYPSVHVQVALGSEDLTVKVQLLYSAASHLTTLIWLKTP